MNVSFVKTRYAEVKNDICGTLFGGVSQITWAAWILSLCLQVVAIVSNMLVVRIRGVSEKEADFTFALDGGPYRRTPEIY